MRRIAILLVCAGVALAAPEAAAASLTATAKSCGTSCGSLDATGGGTLNINGNGAEWGSISSGTVKVEDKSHNGHTDYSLTGCDKRYRQASDTNILVCQANNTIYFSASTVWWLGVNGSNVSVSVVATGGVYIKGSGGYHVNGGARKSWPGSGKFFTL